ncbi:MAG: adenylate/guanylate cyclase domain-containing protein, partial [Acidimicrobiales bacterium]
GLVSPEAIVGMTRVLGQALSRVATAQAQFTTSGIDPASADVPDGATTPPEAQISARVELTVPMNERFIAYAWRRHLAASLRRQLDPRKAEVVGFADLVGYTRLTSQLDGSELPELLARFQHTANHHVGTNGGRVLKVIGDAVMFVAHDAQSAARAALAIRDALADDDAVPAVRIGLAMGPLVEVEGDVYGDTVNRASRLAELARPDTILVDDGLGTALFDVADITVRPLRPRKLKGIGLVRTWSVRNAPGASD